MHEVRGWMGEGYALLFVDGHLLLVSEDWLSSLQSCWIYKSPWLTSIAGVRC